jgi:hypothetical protein
MLATAVSNAALRARELIRIALDLLIVSDCGTVSREDAEKHLGSLAR